MLSNSPSEEFFTWSAFCEYSSIFMNGDLFQVVFLYFVHNHWFKLYACVWIAAVTIFLVVKDHNFNIFVFHEIFFLHMCDVTNLTPFSSTNLIRQKAGSLFLLREMSFGLDYCTLVFLFSTLLFCSQEKCYYLSSLSQLQCLAVVPSSCCVVLLPPLLHVDKELQNVLGS